jgi:16S rRNA (guanine1207-N2)-methyltransferase
MVCLALKDRGGSRLAGDLRDLGCGFSEEARRHHRICTVTGGGDTAAVDAAIAAGAARADARLGFWTQPGIFSWDRIDPGTALLIERLPQLAGRGADFGCGLGIIARAVLASPKVMHLDLVDLDRRAVDMAGRNVTDPRAAFHWADVRAWKPQAILDFVVMNPPFHHAGGEDRGLGQAFVGRAAALLRGGGACWITANRHLPYEAVLGSAFRRWEAVADSGGYKIIQAIK